MLGRLYWRWAIGVATIGGMVGAWAEFSTAGDGLQKTTVFRVTPMAEGEGDGERAEVWGFRIPAVVVTRSGAVLAFCERRVGLEDHAENDLVMRRSEDGGATWGELSVVAEAGGDSLNDPCVVVLESGRVLARYTHFPQGVHARVMEHTVIAEPGYGGEKNVRVFLTWSDDEGASWANGVDVTRSMRRETAISLGSPGVGVQLVGGAHRGRIVLPNYEVYHVGGGKTQSVNSVCYSDDGGATWRLSGKVPAPEAGGWGDEAQLAELADGRLLMSSRDRMGKTFRLLSWSEDGGETWSRQQVAGDLMTPPCMSSVMRYGDGELLLHALPHTEKRRAVGTLMMSRDGGGSWHAGPVIVPRGFAYSSMVELPEGDLGVLYEADAYRTIEFLRVPRSMIVGE